MYVTLLAVTMEPNTAWTNCCGLDKVSRTRVIRRGMGSTRLFHIQHSRARAHRRGKSLELEQMSIWCTYRGSNDIKGIKVGTRHNRSLQQHKATSENRLTGLANVWGHQIGLDNGTITCGRASAH
jgi:hypothetical protein